MKVGVLMGGISSEREVSILSGKSIVNHLDKEKYEVKPIIINSKEEVMEKVKGIDFAFLAFHGEFGEDGSIQAILDAIGIPYSGSNQLTSGICMNKKQTKRILRAESIRVANGISLYKDEEVSFAKVEDLGYPMVVKPNSGGSSIGVSIVKNREDLEESIKEAYKYDNEIIVEQYLKGGEYTVPILNKEPLPVLSIVSKGDFYNYHCKYAEGGSEKSLANLPKEIEEEIKEIGKKCYRIFDCKAYLRVDIIVSNGKPYVLELNTLPGMTEHSLVPKSAEAAGINYRELLDRIIQYSLQ
ncbi:D-alanine--D-alanine ligase [Clostridium paraputrificum]|uniref:D-alanine--D-alanine ligase n=1 Tax=Clostridium paraputrificum TaxID=29363 RepID=UPI003D330A72